MADDKKKAEKPEKAEKPVEEPVDADVKADGTTSPQQPAGGGTTSPQQQAGGGTTGPQQQAAGEEKADERPEPAPSPEPDWKDRYARLLADFDNFKKRTARDREDTFRFAEADILKDVLPTVDNLALALANAKNKEDEFVKGVQLVYDTFLKALKDHGAEPFDSVGQKLDTERMEAIATLPSANVAEGLVSNEAKRGWMLKDKVLRAAQVVVSSGQPA